MADSRNLVDSDERTYRHAALDAAAEREAHRQTGGGAAAPSRLAARSPLTSRASIPGGDGDDARGVYSREAHLASRGAPGWRAREGERAFGRRPDPDARRARMGPDYRRALENAELMRRLAQAAAKYQDVIGLRPDALTGPLSKVLADLEAARENFGQGRGGGYGGPSGGGGGFDIDQFSDLLNAGSKSRRLPDGPRKGPDIGRGSWGSGGGSGWGASERSGVGPSSRLFAVWN